MVTSGQYSLGAEAKIIWYHVCSSLVKFGAALTATR